jgi:hypothetical protein
MTDMPGVITGGTEVMVAIITYGHPNNFAISDGLTLERVARAYGALRVQSTTFRLLVAAHAS